jgi:trigger factor
MKIQVEDKKPCKKALKISLPGTEIKDLHQKVILEFQERSSIPGFRKGNAPLKVIESRFSKDIRSEVLKRLLPKVCGEAFKTEKISALSDPLVDQIEYDLEKGLTFQAVVDVLPQVVLPKYKELKLEQDSLQVTEEEVDRTLEELREHHAVFQPVSGRSLNYGDYAVVEYHLNSQKGKKDDRKNVMIFIQQDEKEGISDQLVGMQIGQTREAALEATNEHPKRTFIIKLNEIKEKKLPEIDEDFFKSIGEIKNLDELRAKLNADI